MAFGAKDKGPSVVCRRVVLPGGGQEFHYLCQTVLAAVGDSGTTMGIRLARTHHWLQGILMVEQAYSDDQWLTITMIHFDIS